MLSNGITYAHEHITIDLAQEKNNNDCCLDCFFDTITELKQLYKLGVRNIIDVTNSGMGQNPTYVQDVAEQTGINIIQAVGWYQEKFLPKIVAEKPVSELANILINTIQNGFPNTNLCPQLIGEIGTSHNKMTENENKVFAASIIAAKQTGVIISTHCTLGTYATEQIKFFKKHNFPLARVVLGHIDLNNNIDYILALLETGVYIQFDTVGKENYLPDSKRLHMLKIIEKAGYTKQVMLSLDITRKSQLKKNGGIGYSYLLTNFVPYLKENGISDTFIEQMLSENPYRFFTRYL